MTFIILSGKKTFKIKIFSSCQILFSNLSSAKLYHQFIVIYRGAVRTQSNINDIWLKAIRSLLGCCSNLSHLYSQNTLSSSRITSNNLLEDSTYLTIFIHQNVSQGSLLKIWLLSVTVKIQGKSCVLFKSTIVYKNDTRYLFKLQLLMQMSTCKAIF